MLFISQNIANPPLQTFRNPKPELLALLAESGPAEANGMRNKDAAKKKGRRDKNVDMEKLADGLQKLGEDDLLHVVTLVHDNKTSETYTKNDVESKFRSSPIARHVLTNDRWRVPRRPLHPTRFPSQDALGLHVLESRFIGCFATRGSILRRFSTLSDQHNTISRSHVHDPSQHPHARET